MGILIVAIIVLGIVVALSAKFFGKGDADAPIIEQGGCATCTGDNSKCEQECMMEAATKDIEYYDDEHLDTYRGRMAEDYTDDEAEEFREVLYTMRQDEAEGWNRSLILRGINVPNQIKDELIMMIGN